MKRSAIALVLFAAALAAAGPAGAQATRTWISGVGDDVNPCSRTAPCKTFAGAIAKTATGGEIDALDPGGFGSLTITKSITLDGGSGQNASILASGVNAINIVAGSTNVSSTNVSIRNLSIQGSGTGLNGISFTGGGSLHIEHCVIANFSGDGIHLAPSSAAQVFVDDTISRGNAGSGLNALGTSAILRVSIFNSRFPDNANGVFAADFTKMTARSSDASGNTMWGFVALGVGGPASINVADTGVSDNAMGGLMAGGTGAMSSVIRMNNVSISGNGVGTTTGTNGVIASFGNNYNSNSGAPTIVITPQ